MFETYGTSHSVRSYLLNARYYSLFYLEDFDTNIPNLNKYTEKN